METDKHVDEKLNDILIKAKQLEKEQDFLVNQDFDNYTSFNLGLLKGIQRIVKLIERNI